MQTIITIDPGVKGGAAVWNSTDKAPKTFELEQGDQALVDFLKPYSNHPHAVCYLEKVGGYIPKGEDGAGQPGSRMFVFGSSYGFIRGVLLTLQIKTIYVLPQQWQKGIPGRDGSYSQRKIALSKHAQKLFPDLKVNNAVADALAMLHYARSVQKLNGTKAPPIVAKPNPGQTTKKPAISSQLVKPPVKPPVKPKFETMDEALTEIKRSSSDRTQAEAASVADLPMKKQMQLAIAWCERNHYPVPESGTPERANMLNYWLNLAINGEA